MNFTDNIDFGLEAVSQSDPECDIEIESVRFNNRSKRKLEGMLMSKTFSTDNAVLWISRLFIDQDNFGKIKHGGRYSGRFFPDFTPSFDIKNFDLCYESKKVKQFGNRVIISDVMMVVYAI